MMNWWNWNCIIIALTNDHWSSHFWHHKDIHTPAESSRIHTKLSAQRRFIVIIINVITRSFDPCLCNVIHISCPQNMNLDRSVYQLLYIHRKALTHRTNRKPSSTLSDECINRKNVCPFYFSFVIHVRCTTAHCTLHIPPTFKLSFWFLWRATRMVNLNVIYLSTGI